MSFFFSSIRHNKYFKLQFFFNYINSRASSIQGSSGQWPAVGGWRPQTQAPPGREGPQVAPGRAARLPELPQALTPLPSRLLISYFWETIASTSGSLMAGGGPSRRGSLPSRARRAALLMPAAMETAPPQRAGARSAVCGA